MPDPRPIDSWLSPRRYAFPAVVMNILETGFSNLEGTYRGADEKRAEASKIITG